jgi:inner membrane protease ATP23
MAEDTSEPQPRESPSTPQNDPAITGYEPSGGWRNYFNILSNRMTDAGKHAFREDAYIRNEERDCKRCDEWKDYLFKYSPIIRFMSTNITELNGKLDGENVRCQRCVTRVVEEKDENGNMVTKYRRQGGGFSPDHGILICANEMRSQGHMEDTMAHEMVHAYDHLRFKVDWSDLRHAACTEVWLILPMSRFSAILPCRDVLMTNS